MNGWTASIIVVSIVVVALIQRGPSRPVEPCLVLMNISSDKCLARNDHGDCTSVHCWENQEFEDGSRRRYLLWVKANMSSRVGPCLTCKGWHDDSENCGACGKLWAWTAPESDTVILSVA
jgi:hypothetical protein